MRAFIYILILGSLVFAPVKSAEIANLEPVQAVWIYMVDQQVVLETDTDDKGSGSSVAAALEDMKQKSPGIIYLHTAQYLFVAESAQQQIPAIKPYVKGAIRLCRWEAQGDIQEAVKYADAHKLGIKLHHWDTASNLPELPPIKQEKYGKIPS